MVLGGGKKIAIGHSDLLACYQNLFSKVLRAGDVRVMVIGYGFHDDHINKILAEAVQSFGARMFIWDKQHPLQFLNAVPIADPSGPGRTFDFRPYLCGAASRNIAEVFPFGAHPSTEYRRIVSSFF